MWEGLQAQHPGLGHEPGIQCRFLCLLGNSYIVCWVSGYLETRSSWLFSSMLHLYCFGITFPGGISQWALSLDRVQRKDPMKADHLSKTWFCYDFTKMVTHQPGKLNEPETRCNAILPSLCLNSQGLVTYMLLVIIIWFLFIFTIRSHSTYGPHHTALLPHHSYSFWLPAHQQEPGFFLFSFYHSPVIFVNDSQSHQNPYLSLCPNIPPYCLLPEVNSRI